MGYRSGAVIARLFLGAVRMLKGDYPGALAH